MKLPSKADRMSMAERIYLYHQQLFTPEAAAHLNYLQVDRGLTLATIQHFMLGAVISPAGPDSIAAGMLSIPYNRPAGPISIRFRQPPGNESKMKYYQPAGTELGLFNTEPVTAGGSWAVVCEGEIDTMTAVQCGLPAIGVPGITAWKDHHPAVFAGFERVIILADNDDKGQGSSFAESVAKVVPGPVIHLMPQGHDVNSFVVAEGADAFLRHIKLK